jgi:hypothetical protein
MTTSVGTAKKNGKPSSLARSYTSVQIVRSEVESLIKAHFSSTLGTIPDIVKLVLACIYKESAFNANANSGIHGDTQLKRFLKYTAISSKFKEATTSEQERVNMRNSVAGFGLLQATGWYLIKGAGPDGKTELSRMRSDLAGPLLVEPGVDINTVLGPTNITNQLLAGLIILEDKYKVAPSLVKNPPTVDKPYTDRIMATFGGFLGKGVDKFGSTPQDYAASIIRGDSYRIANGSSASSPKKNNGNTIDGPIRTAASGNNLGPAGC